MSESVPTPGTDALLSLPSEREIRIERVFAAPRELVWRAFTEPQLIAQWYCRGNFIVVERFEPVRGGHWRFVEHAPDGVHGFEGRFREVTPPERIVMTFEWDGMPGYPSVETHEFEDLDGERTRLVLITLFYLEEERDGMLGSGMEGGMNQSFDALDRLLARLA
jgi:uncharacterized protein YndB with AHSA1/START domain